MKKRFAIMTVTALVACLAIIAESYAKPGDQIVQVNLPVQGFGVSVAVDCDGNVYYTSNGQFNLYVIDKNGALLNTLPTVDAATGAALDLDEMAYDVTRGVLWAQLHGSNPIDVYHVDPATGISTFQWTSTTNSLGSFRDGIAYDGSDDTVWLSGDVSSTIEHYASDGTYLGQITPKNAAGGTLGTISGVMVGVGDLLYLGRNGLTQIVQVTKSNGDFIGSFASPGGTRDEGLECDPVNFGPTLALWSRDVNNFLSVIEIEEGTCTCGGVPVIEVPIDIKPQSCPNPLQTGKKGVVPVAILGTEDLDVAQIDPESVLLEGVAPLRSSLEDVATPFEPFAGKEDCLLDCTTAGPDGLVDLTLKFDSQELVAALGAVANGECRVVTLTGNLKEEFGGTDITGEDVIRIQSRSVP